MTYVRGHDAGQDTGVMGRDMDVILFHRMHLLIVLESQLPHKIVNSLFTITNQNIKMTVLWGS